MFFFPIFPQSQMCETHFINHPVIWCYLLLSFAVSMIIEVTGKIWDHYCIILITFAEKIVVIPFSYIVYAKPNQTNCCQIRSMTGQVTKYFFLTCVDLENMETDNIVLIGGITL